jgi:hypothetical protein
MKEGREAPRKEGRMESSKDRITEGRKEGRKEGSEGRKWRTEVK